MERMTATCALCDAEPAHAHHLTGRPAAKETYLDPALVLGACQHHHVNLHVWLRAVGLAWPRPGANALAYRLRRAAIHTRAVAAQGRPLTFAAGPAGALADLLDEAAEKIEPSTSGEPADVDQAPIKREVWV